MSTDAAEEIVALYKRYFGEIFAYCVHRVFKTDLAEDAASATFLRLVEKYPTLRTKSEKDIHNWLYGTASNVVAGCFRDVRRRREIAAELARERQRIPAQKPSGDSRLDWPVLYEAIGRLKPRHREIITLRYFCGLETSAIAQALGIRHVTARVRLSRTIKKLRQQLKGPFGEPHGTT